MKGICPICEAERELENVISKEVITVRGDRIEVDANHLRCLTCNGDFDGPLSEGDVVSKAFREYRKMHGMIQPEEIKSFRKRYGFTQAELSAILGWGIATLNRYENGALQGAAHENELSMAMEPHNLLGLITRSPEALSAAKRNSIIKELEREELEAYSLERVIEINYSQYEPNVYSGYKKFFINKFTNAILLFCKNGGEFKTKLNKLLFYADFVHFKHYATSITGAQYARITFGPVPDNYEFHFAAFIKKGILEVKEYQYPNGYIGEMFSSAIEPDLNVFTESELRTLLMVKEYFKDYTATAIKDFSHEEDGYKNTPNCNLIDYKYASSLRIG